MTRQRFDRHVTVRLREQDADVLEEQAEQCGLSISDTVRLLINGYRVVVPANGATNLQPAQREVFA